MQNRPMKPEPKRNLDRVESRLSVSRRGARREVAAITKSWAVRAYREGILTLAKIAEVAEVSAGTISLWGKAAGEPRRTRGRRALAAPTLKHARILRALETQSYGAVARQFGTHKSRIWWVAKRWRDLNHSGAPGRAEKRAPRLPHNVDLGPERDGASSVDRSK